MNVQAFQYEYFSQVWEAIIKNFKTLYSKNSQTLRTYNSILNTLQ